jgi:lipid A disaccharide synthetase
LPGSRKNELDRTVPVMAKAIPLIQAQVPNVQFVVACAPNMADSLFAPLVDDDLDANVVLVRDRTDDVLAASDVVITRPHGDHPEHVASESRWSWSIGCRR